jgi:hypothetical protein
MGADLRCVQQKRAGEDHTFGIDAAGQVIRVESFWLDTDPTL